MYVHIAEHLRFSTKFQYDNSSGFLPVNAHAEVNILNLNYIVSCIFYSSMTKLLNDMRIGSIQWIFWFSVRYAAAAHREIFSVNALRKTTAARYTKFAGYLHWGVSFKMAAMGISLKIIYIFTPQPSRVVRVLFSPMVSGCAGGRQEIDCPGCISETVLSGLVVSKFGI